MGPRPPLPREVVKYTPRQRLRLATKPGLTCFWQVHPARNSLDFDSWVDLDLQYIQSQSYLLDWKLIFLTVRAVIQREGM